MQTIPIMYTGKKAKVGGLTFNERGHMCYFVGYCECCRGKVTMTRAEAEQFANRFNFQKKRIADRLLIRMIKNRTMT